jgi:uncharacterized protein
MESRSRRRGVDAGEWIRQLLFGAKEMTDAAEASNQEPAPVVRVVSFSVRSGREADFKRWLWGTVAAAHAFEGFLGAELLPPGPGAAEWTLTYRFDSGDSLTSWLRSPERAHVLADAPPVFEAEHGEYTLDPQQPSKHGVTIVSSHRVLPGREPQYRSACSDMHRVAARFPGFGGAEILAPGPESDEHTVLLRFDTQQNMDRFLESEERADGRKAIYEHTLGHRTKVVPTGFGHWFAFNAEDGLEAPAWKQAAIVVLALFPTVMVISLTVGAWLGANRTPLPVVVLSSNVIVTVILTWLAMPIVTRLMAWWLTPRCVGVKTSLGSVVLLAGYGLELLFFLLLTAE